MNYKITAVCFYFAIALLAIGLCWNIYQSANTIDHAFSEFTEQEIQTLDNLFRVRTNLSEHERLLYEYYATTERTSILIKLTLVRDTLQDDLSYLKNIFNNNEQYQVLEQTYAGFTEELERLDKNLKAPSIDWDTARESLVNLTAHGQAAIPALDYLFDMVGEHSSNTQKMVEAQLGEMIVLVIGFVFVVLVVALAVGFFIRETLHANAERRKLSYFTERNPIAIFSLSLEGELIYANPATHRLAAKIDDNLQNILPPDIKSYVQRVRESKENSLTFDYQLNDHTLSATMQLLPDLKVCHIYIKDVTREREAKKELQYLVNHDPVSGVPNRRSFITDCNNWVEEQGYAFSVLILGFHNFEIIARNLGVEVVDELIKDIGKRLNLAILKSELNIHTARCYRFSGASFAILLRSDRDSEIKKMTNMTAELLIEEVSQPIHVKRREFWLQPVVGASFCPEDALTTSNLINNASAAMAHLIEEGQHGYQPTIAKIINAEQNWLDIESGLRQGLEKGEFRVHYQPKVTVKGFHVHGMEALIRWNREGHRMVNPAEFIPVAEDSGLIVLLGAWILDESCRQATEWYNSGHSNFSIAINIS
ncbi:MAG: EAL domain-containing protein, partial [Proteobacteria bacterium]|nr:EAL domain-containing protein [Pseudomonadota bacterium]